jgi:hypothetical protein
MIGHTTIPPICPLTSFDGYRLQAVSATDLMRGHLLPANMSQDPLIRSNSEYTSNHDSKQSRLAWSRSTLHALCLSQSVAHLVIEKKARRHIASASWSRKWPCLHTGRRGLQDCVHMSLDAERRHHLHEAFAINLLRWLCRTPFADIDTRKNDSLTRALPRTTLDRLHI